MKRRWRLRARLLQLGVVRPGVATNGLAFHRHFGDVIAMNFTMAAGLTCLSLGTWLVYAALGAREKRVALLRNCVRVRGRVARVEDASSEGDTLSSWAAIVAYTAQDGRTYEYKMTPHFDQTKVRIGMKVPIFYERGSPGNATAQPRMWGVNLACALSFVPVLLGFGFLFTAYQEYVAAAR